MKTLEKYILKIDNTRVDFKGGTLKLQSTVPSSSVWSIRPIVWHENTSSSKFKELWSKKLKIEAEVENKFSRELQNDRHVQRDASVFVN